MKFGYDFKTDNSDDIFLNGDIFTESDFSINVLKNAERRVSARYDDFVLENIGAGLERYLGKKINDQTRYILTEEIRRSLGSDGLLSGNEYTVFIPPVENTRKMPIFLQFSSPYISGTNTFKVLINIENQRSYK